MQLDAVDINFVRGCALKRAIAACHYQGKYLSYIWIRGHLERFQGEDPGCCDDLNST